MNGVINFINIFGMNVDEFLDGKKTIQIGAEENNELKWEIVTISTNTNLPPLETESQQSKQSHQSKQSQFELPQTELEVAQLQQLRKYLDFETVVALMPFLTKQQATPAPPSSPTFRQPVLQKKTTEIKHES